MKKYRITIDGSVYDVEVEEVADTHVQKTAASELRPVNSASAKTVQPEPVLRNGNTVKAPMPGKVLSVAVRAGQQVTAGEVLMILEAMKMENEILAPADGTVQTVAVAEGVQVNTGDVMAVLG